MQLKLARLHDKSFHLITAVMSDVHGIETVSLRDDIRSVMSPDLQRHYMLVDLRPEAVRERLKDGIANSVNVEWDDRNSKLEVGYFPVEKEVQIVLYCLNGKMAAKAKVFLEAEGYINVLNAYNTEFINSALGTKRV